MTGKPEIPCGTCPYRDNEGPVLPDGPQEDCRFIVLGEGPGFDEIQQGRNLSGAAGREFWALAGAAGIERKDCRVVNLVRCLPTGAAAGNYELDEEAIRHCSVYLDEENARCHPDAKVITLGGTVLRTVTGLTPMQRYRGAVLWKTPS